MDNPDLAFMAKMVLDLFIVIGLILAFIYILRRFQGKRSRQNHQDLVARVQQTVSLGNKQQLHVVSWHQKKYLIGMANGHGFVIDRLENPTQKENDRDRDRDRDSWATSFQGHSFANQASQNHTDKRNSSHPTSVVSASNAVGMASKPNSQPLANKSNFNDKAGRSLDKDVINPYKHDAQDR